MHKTLTLQQKCHVPGLLTKRENECQNTFNRLAGVKNVYDMSEYTFSEYTLYINKHSGFQLMVLSCGPYNSSGRSVGAVGVAIKCVSAQAVI